MVLYVLVGIEIFKRRRALNHIASDSMDPIVSTSDNPPGHANNAIALTTDVGVKPPPGHAVDVHDEPPSTPARSTVRSVNSPSNHAPRKRSSLSFKQYVLMPLLFFIVLLSIWAAPSINRASAFVNPGSESYPMLLAVGCTSSLRGFWNAVVFIALGMKAGRGQGRRTRVVLSRRA